MEELDLYAELPCPVKPAFKEKFNTFNTKFYQNHNEIFKTYIPSILGSQIKHNVFNVEQVNSLPKLSITYAFGEITKRKFVKNFIESGVFSFHDFYELAYFSELILIRRQEGKGYPTSWLELCNKEYQGRIVSFGANNKADYLVPLLLYKEYGIDYVKKFFSNILYVAQPAEIARQINKSSAKATRFADIFILPYVFAKECLNNAEMLIPSEGVIVEPLIILNRNDKTKKTNELLNFLQSQSITEEFTRQGFLSASQINQVFNKIYKFDYNFIYSGELEKIKSLEHFKKEML